MLLNKVFPFLKYIDAETAHNIALLFLSQTYLSKVFLPFHQKKSACAANFLGTHYESPIGIAAGFDKNAYSLESLSHIAVGFIEVGTITPKKQYGNPKPRLFRVHEHHSIINRMGFPNQGMHKIYPRILRYYQKENRKKLWVNIGPNKDSTNPIDDYVTLADHFVSCSDMLVINVSSPNTPHLREWQKPEKIHQIITHIFQKTGRTSIAVKLAPDIESSLFEDVLLSVMEAGASAVIISNTTTKRSSISNHSLAQEDGGLSGDALYALSTEKCAHAFHVLKIKFLLLALAVLVRTII